MLVKFDVKFLLMLFGIGISSIFSVLAQHVVQTDTSQYKTIRLDPGNAMGGNVSDIFDRISFIPLETTKESSFGSVNQLVIVDDYYIILDRNTNSILFFTKSGKFHAKIKGRTDNPNYIIWKMIVNRWKRQVMYFTNDFTNVVYCDFDGKIVKREKLIDPRSTENNFFRGMFIGKNDILNYVEYRSSEASTKVKIPKTNSLFKYMKTDGTIYATGMEYTAAESKMDILNAGIGPLTYSGNDSTLFFSKPYANSIYEITPKRIKLDYKFVFPLAASITSDFASNASYNGKRTLFLQKNDQLIFSLTNFYQVGDNLFFKAGAYKPYKEDNLIYNLKSGNLIAYKRILADSMSYFLPIYDDVSSTFQNTGIAACDGEFLYTSSSSLALFQAKEANFGQKIIYSETLTKYFKDGSKNSNPVIIQIKVKNDL